jgi:predicted Zn-dependent protease with MMP-like domain
MKHRDFERLVITALEDLPEFFKQKMENVSLVIEDEPTSEQVAIFETTHREIVVGLYQGVPLSDRTHLYGMVLPDQITIFKKNIERVCRNNAEIKKLVNQTVQHELAHHFGISDQRLRELGAY